MSQSRSHSPRIRPLEPPYPAEIQERFDRIMPHGMPPLALFRIMARDERLTQRFFGASLLDKGHLSLRQREIVIDRVTARAGSEYEWGVHVAMFAKAAGFGASELAALAHGTAAEPCWSAQERTLVAMIDSLHDHCDISEPLWQEACAHFAEEAIMEILMLAGFYRMVAYITNALRLPQVPFAPRFPVAQAGSR